MVLGIVPDYAQAVRKGRGDLCETMAIAGCQLIADGRTDRLVAVMRFVVNRNADVLSGGVRDADGRLVVAMVQWFTFLVVVPLFHALMNMMGKSSLRNCNTSVC